MASTYTNTILIWWKPFLPLSQTKWFSLHRCSTIYSNGRDVMWVLDEHLTLWNVAFCTDSNQGSWTINASMFYQRQYSQFPSHETLSHAKSVLTLILFSSPPPRVLDFVEVKLFYSIYNFFTRSPTSQHPAKHRSKEERWQTQLLPNLIHSIITRKKPPKKSTCVSAV